MGELLANTIMPSSAQLAPVGWLGIGQIVTGGPPSMDTFRSADPSK